MGTIKSIKIEIDTNSLFTDNDQLTTHLKSNDFFNVKQFPKATYEASGKQIEAVDGNSLEMVFLGNMTLLGKTKQVKIPVKLNTDRGNIYLTGDFSLSRKEFGMTYTKGAINDEVKVKFSVGQPPTQ